MVTRRVFRSAGETKASGFDTNVFDHKRVWEDIGAGTDMDTTAKAFLDFVEIVSPEEIAPDVYTKP